MYEGHTEETEKQFQIGVEKVQAPFNLLHHLPSKNWVKVKNYVS